MRSTFRAVAGPLALALAAGAASAQTTGPSTTTVPYILPNPAYASQVSTTSILTVGDSIGGYRMVGIPDGLGAFPNQDGSFTLSMNHEFGAGSGVVHAHGSTGAFVSRWVITPDLQVLSGRDHLTAPTDVHTWNGTQYVTGASAFARFCSADLPAVGAFSFGALGTTARIHMNGEESGSEGRAMAHILTGPDADQSYELPRLGKFSWENSVASPFPQARTIVIGTDDTTPGQVYVYIGTKTDSGNTIERAGLANGELYAIRVQLTPLEQRAAPPAAGTRFDIYNHGDVSAMTGAQIQAQDAANNVTEFLRPEDSAWDPRPGHENTFYFVTTDRFNRDGQVGRSRLWQVSFDDITFPENGGTITALLDGTEGGNMFDNICVDSLGRIILQEDIGGNDPLGKVWLYSTQTSQLIEVAAHRADYFSPGAANFLTIDEEASGVFDAAPYLGQGWFMLDVQAHYANGAELVEGGQLLAMYIDPALGTPVCTADFDHSGVVNSQDFFEFITAFFAEAPAADFNQSGAIDSQDFFDFVAAFFVGC